MTNDGEMKRLTQTYRAAQRKQGNNAKAFPFPETPVNIQKSILFHFPPSHILSGVR
jgi:hypothetical protein